MALNDKQKTEIQRRALNGESGASLAAEFGVSPSAISVIKNHYKPEVKATKTVVEKAKTVTATKSISAKKQETFTAVVSSTKSTAKRLVLPVGSTFGDLMTAADEHGALEGVFKNAKSGEKSRIKTLKTVIDAEANSEYHVYLLPIKIDSGL